MKKRTFLVVVLCILAVFTLAVTVSAGTISVTDNDEAGITLGQGTIANLEGVTIPSPTKGLAYSLDTDTMTASVSGRGSFGGGVLSFPSTVTYDGKTYTVTKIESSLFRSLSYDLYVPDNITFIGGGSNMGTFGNSTIGYAYIGSGLNGFERETFSGSKGYKTFVCKSKLTYIGVYAFNQNSASAEFEGLELDLTHVARIEDYAFAAATILSKGEIAFGDQLEYVGSQAFVESFANGSVIIPANCTLSHRCFNGTSFEFVYIKVPKGETRELPQELFSGAHGPMTVVIDGNATTDKPHVLSNNAMSIYMPTLAQAQALASAIGKQSNNARLLQVTFYACETGHKYSSASDGTLTDLGEADSHCYTEEPVKFPANCTQGERYSYICYSCGNEKVESESQELGKHIYNVNIKAPSCLSQGYYEYTCTVCGVQESAHFSGKISHTGTVYEYKLLSNQILEITTRCEDCNSVVSVENQSLVNKCYIEGYGLFDATTEYISVSKDGVATPNSQATFNKAVIYFPSFVEVDGSVVEIKTIQGFKAKSIKAIYVPDTVTRIAGGSGVGCFGDCYDLKNIVVGKGVTTLEQEVFSLGRCIYVDEFIFKGVITRINKIAMQNLCASSSDIPYEFGTNLTYVGEKVNLNGNILREAKIAKNCDLHEKFAFNNANGLLTVYIEGGDTPETALDLGQEFTSNTCTKYLYIKGYVTVSGQAVLSGMNNSRIYMSNTAAIDLFTSAIKAQSFKERINSATFFDCETGKAWLVRHDADRTEHTTVAFAHGGVMSSTQATCTQKGSVVESCFVCGEVVSTEEVDMLPHQLDGGTITKMPTISEKGIIVYKCLTCQDTVEKDIFKLSQIHTESVSIVYANGYAEAGMSHTSCAYCDYLESRDLLPMVEVLGYSVSEDRTGIVCGYRFNNEMIKYCEDNMENFEFGFVVANASDVEAARELFDDGNNVLSSVRGFKVKITSKSYSYFDVKVIGANTEELKNADFLLSLYVYSDSDGNGELDRTYIQHTMNGGNNKPIQVGDQVVNTISINRAGEEIK